MLQNKPLSDFENALFKNHGQIKTAAKFLKFSLILIFGAFVFLNAAETSRAAVFVVDRTDDASISACTSAANDCTLRGAIAAANRAASNDLIRFDETVFSAPSIVTLTDGELKVVNNGTLEIFGAESYENNSVTIDANLQSRVFLIDSSANLTISNITISRGSAASSGGGGIRNNGRLTLNRVRITGNSAVFGGGGGIYNENTGTITISRSTIDKNVANANAGGIINSGGVVAIEGSTISNNESGETNGGILNSGSFTLTNSTVSDNFADQFGAGGIGNSGEFNLIYSTVSRNRSSSAFSTAGGIVNSGTFNSRGSIIANNGDGIRTYDFSGTLNSLGYNLIEDTRNATITGDNTGNILGQDPLLDPNGLQYNGGSTRTIALLPGSPAIDAADPNNFPGNDQRGFQRPFDGDDDGTAFPDIGAFEKSDFVVTKTADTNDGVCDTDCSLREAIAAANSDARDNVISFSPLVFNTAQIVVLTSGRLDISNNGLLNINGRGTNLLKISGGNQSSVFNILPNANVTINDLTVADGNSAIGGGILTSGVLTLNRVLVTNCKASGGGGGIYINSNLPVTINFSTISGNSTSDNGAAGGGIGGDNNDSLIIINTMIVNNSSSLGGGVQLNRGTMSFRNSLIGNNTATDSGGGIISQTGTIAIGSSSVVSNSAANEGGGIRSNGAVTTTKAEIKNNTSVNGGGIFINGVLSMLDSTVDGNRAGFGGGISKYGSLSAGIEGSTISNNRASDSAGGIFNIGGYLQIINSTISGNSAAQDGGGINNFGELNLINTTIANNTAGSGGGVFNIPGTVNARNTIIADNSSEDFFGRLNSQGFNLIENTTNTTIISATSGDIITGQDPQLFPLGNYGGTTKTHALRPTSPAIDKGKNGVPTKTIDQRGLPRPFDFPNIPNAVGGDGSDIGAFERQPEDAGFKTKFDFDGDGRADISVFRPSNGTWYVQQSTNGFTGAQWGVGTDTLVPGDYDGDGRTDYAVFRKSDNSSWYILRSSDNTFQSVQFGAPNIGQAILFDTPVPADYDGDGKTDYAYYRLTDSLAEPGGFSILRSSDNTVSSIRFGAFGDRPIPADYDGDGKADIAVNRGGFWYILRSSDNQFFGIQFGTAQDKLVPADYDGDGKTDIAVYRESSGTWYYLQSGNENSFVGVRFGASEDKPVPADYDGDGKADIAVFRPSSGAWYRLNSSNNSFYGLLFGFGTDKPIPNAFVR